MSTVTGYDNLTNGQTKAIVSIMGGVEVARAFLNGEYKLTKVTKGVNKALKYLKYIGKVTIEVTEQVTLSEFFNSSREDFWVDKQFVNLFVDDTSSQEGSFNLSKFEITNGLFSHNGMAIGGKYVSDWHVREDLPEGHVFDSEEFCPILATLIKKQWEGTRGCLFVNGGTNVFYVRAKDKKNIFVVGAHWFAYNRDVWIVRVKKLNEDQQTSIDCIFSRN